MENRLGITDSVELAKVEDRISKLKASELFETGELYTFEVGTFYGLAQIHKALFDEIYDFAGKIREVDYLEQELNLIENMPQTNFDEIFEKFVKITIAQPFMQGNERSLCIWFDLILWKEIKKVIDWNKIDKSDYLLAMEKYESNDLEIKNIFRNALTEDFNNREFFIKDDYTYEAEIREKILNMSIDDLEDIVRNRKNSCYWKIYLLAVEELKNRTSDKYVQKLNSTKNMKRGYGIALIAILILLPIPAFLVLIKYLSSISNSGEYWPLTLVFGSVLFIPAIAFFGFFALLVMLCLAFIGTTMMIKTRKNNDNK